MLENQAQIKSQKRVAAKYAHKFCVHVNEFFEFRFVVATLPKRRRR